MSEFHKRLDRLAYFHMGNKHVELLLSEDKAVAYVLCSYRPLIKWNSRVFGLDGALREARREFELLVKSLLEGEEFERITSGSV